MFHRNRVQKLQIVHQLSVHNDRQMLSSSKLEITVASKGLPDRSQNVIIHGLPESEAKTFADRELADHKLFQGLLNKLLRPTEVVDVQKHFRLGKRPNDLSERARPRPLKVVLDSEEQAKLILARRFRIKDNGCGVFFQPDYTPAERKKRRQLVLEMRLRLQNGETNLVIYNDQITHRPPRIRWTEPIRMRAQLSPYTRVQTGL